jgi:hypothetical protein
MSMAALLRRSRETTRLLPPKLSPLLRRTRATALLCLVLWVLLFSLCRERSLHFRSSLLGTGVPVFSRLVQNIALLALLGVLVGRLSPSSLSSSPRQFPSTVTAFGPFHFHPDPFWLASWTNHAREAGGAKRATKDHSLFFFFFVNLTKLHDSLYISSCTKSIHTRHFTSFPISTILLSSSLPFLTVFSRNNCEWIALRSRLAQRTTAVSTLKSRSNLPISSGLLRFMFCC